MSRGRLEDVFKVSSRRLKDVLKAFSQNVLKTVWRRLEDVWPRQDQDILKTSSEDEDERRLQDNFKTCASRQMFAGMFVNKIHVTFTLVK